jgi:hypothetical protein
MEMDILTSIHINEIYSNNLTRLDDISKFLNLSGEDIDSELDDYYRFMTLIESGVVDILDTSVYGEITSEGVKELGIILGGLELSGVFYDIGSGNGKLLVHMSLISNFSGYVGIELSRIRYLYSLSISSFMGDRVSFINGDVKDMDLSDAGFIFMNDIMFGDDLRLLILDLIPVGCYFLSFYESCNELVNSVTLSVSWMLGGVSYYIYRRV